MWPDVSANRQASGDLDPEDRPPCTDPDIAFDDPAIRAVFSDGARRDDPHPSGARLLGKPSGELTPYCVCSPGAVSHDAVARSLTPKPGSFLSRS